jgi:predicted nucleic acid-binding protein
VKAISNAGPIIHLSWVDRLDLLSDVFEEVLVPPAVRDEVLRVRDDVRGATTIRAAFTASRFLVRPVIDRSAVARLRNDLDRGEAEAIALGQEMRHDMVLLDDKKARVRAQALGLSITGTVGILRMARDRELLQSITPVLDQLQRYGFRISALLLQTIGDEEETRATGEIADRQQDW